MEFKPTVLVVEDNEKLRGLLALNLSKQFNVIAAKNFRESLDTIQHHTIHIACLDIILPDGSGLEICKILKREYPNTKVIILSNKSQIDDRLKVFNTGADDYLPKPFFFEELTARIRNLLHLNGESNIMVKDNFSLDTSLGVLKYRENAMNLTKNQTILMMALLNSSKKYCDVDSVSRTYSAYTIRKPSEESIMVSLSRLKIRIRREWGMDLIHSKYGYGYYLK
ncbi:response regulator transcription factor [Candidatus Dojkabacteria bacterium]|nr:response regulator transcription factor [Candidatus Dojkabacteria bacterium]